MNPSFGYVFPAIRGVQAGREYYISMCPLRLIPKIFQFDEIELRPELRAQRVLNKARIPEMTRYLVNNTNGYVFSAITASVDAEVEFESIGEGRDGEKVGQLHIPMDARFVINDGQHRRAAIEEAIKDHPELGDETIGVVFFLDSGLERCQQMFADLNRYAIRPSTSIGVLYDHRDELAILTKRMVHQSPVFRDLVEMEKTTLAPRSRRLFTLSALYSGNRALLQKSDTDDLESRAASRVASGKRRRASSLNGWRCATDGLPLEMCGEISFTPTAWCYRPSDARGRDSSASSPRHGPSD